MPKSHNPTGRSKNDASHLRLYHWIIRSEGYRALSCAARGVLIEIALGHHGANNGRLGLSVRDAAERCRLARGTAARAFSELQEVGFIDCVTKGAFSLKARHASEWRLTWLKCDVTGNPPDKRFARWTRKINASAKISRDGINRERASVEKCSERVSTVLRFVTTKRQAASS
jgi:hypothetical protein